MTVKEEATYVLSIKVTINIEKTVGRLGKMLFEKGDYVYIGSAKGCLRSRLKRHLRKEKKTYWHIDYLLESKKSKIIAFRAKSRSKSKPKEKESPISSIARRWQKALEDSSPWPPKDLR